MPVHRGLLETLVNLVHLVQMEHQVRRAHLEPLVQQVLRVMWELQETLALREQKEIKAPLDQQACLVPTARLGPLVLQDPLDHRDH